MFWNAWTAFSIHSGRKFCKLLTKSHFDSHQHSIVQWTAWKFLWNLWFRVLDPLIGNFATCWSSFSCILSSPSYLSNKVFQNSSDCTYMSCSSRSRYCGYYLKEQLYSMYLKRISKLPLICFSSSSIRESGNELHLQGGTYVAEEDILLCAVDGMIEQVKFQISGLGDTEEEKGYFTKTGILFQNWLGYYVHASQMEASRFPSLSIGLWMIPK